MTDVAMSGDARGVMLAAQRLADAAQNFLRAAAFLSYAMNDKLLGVKNTPKYESERDAAMSALRLAISAFEAAMGGGVREENARLRDALMMARGYVDLSDRNVTGLTPTWREVVADIDAALSAGRGEGAGGSSAGSLDAVD